MTALTPGLLKTDDVDTAHGCHLDHFTNPVMHGVNLWRGEPEYLYQLPEQLILNVQHPVCLRTTTGLMTCGVSVSSHLYLVYLWTTVLKP